MPHAQSLRTFGVDLPIEIIDRIKGAALERRMTIKAFVLWCFELGIEAIDKEMKAKKRQRKEKASKRKGKPNSHPQTAQDEQIQTQS